MPSPAANAFHVAMRGRVMVSNTVYVVHLSGLLAFNDKFEAGRLMSDVL